MESLLWLSIASALVYALLGGCGLALRIGRPKERENGAASLVGFALCAFATARAVEIAWPGDADPLSLVADVAALAAFVATAQFVVIHARVRHAHAWMLSSYAIGFFYAVCSVVGELQWTHAPSEKTIVLSLFERPATPIGWSLYVTSAAAAALFTLACAKRWMAGARESAGTTLGTASLLISIAHDAGVAAGAFHGPWLMQLGFIAFLFSTGASFIARYVTVANELEESTVALEERTRQLAQSYSDLRETQEELVRKEQLAVVGELAAVVAHEVRNPLAVIANAVAGLRKPSLAHDDRVTLLGILEDETSRLNRLVSDLLRYARPVNVQRSQVMLDDLLERALRFTQGTSGVTVEKMIDSEHARIWGDPSLLRQVFDNLVDNAVQAMPLGGNLSIRVGASQEDGVEGVSVIVGDTGEGMDTIVRARARDPFFTTRPSGTGLGLAIVDRIVEAHAGHLLIDSRAGEGTTVTVFLPIGRPSDLPGASEAQKKEAS